MSHEVDARSLARDDPWPVALGRDHPADPESVAPGAGLEAGEFCFVLSQWGMTQRQFADWVGVNERSVRRWASGANAIPKWVALIISLKSKLAGEAFSFVD